MLTFYHRTVLLFLCIAQANAFTTPVLSSKYAAKSALRMADGPPYAGPASKPLLDSVEFPQDMKDFTLKELKQVCIIHEPSTINHLRPVQAMIYYGIPRFILLHHAPPFTRSHVCFIFVILTRHDSFHLAFPFQVLTRASLGGTRGSITNWRTS